MDKQSVLKKIINVDELFILRQHLKSVLFFSGKFILRSTDFRFSSLLMYESIIRQKTNSLHAQWRIRKIRLLLPKHLQIPGPSITDYSSLTDIFTLEESKAWKLAESYLRTVKN
jgi:hypothetical protein